MQHSSLTTLAPHQVRVLTSIWLRLEHPVFRATVTFEEKGGRPVRCCGESTSEGGLVFLFALACYLVVSVLLDIKYKTF